VCPLPREPCAKNMERYLILEVARKDCWVLA
jgi:hypothetical protein